MTRAGVIGVALGLIYMSLIVGWIASRVGKMRKVKMEIAAV